MRVVFAGTPEVALPALDAIADSRHELVGVVTRPAAPARFAGGPGSRRRRDATSSAGTAPRARPSASRSYLLEPSFPASSPARMPASGPAKSGTESITTGTPNDSYAARLRLALIRT